MDAKTDHGAKLATFEVRPSATASVSDEFHVVRPASDGAIALAMARVIIDEQLADTVFWERWANVPLARVREQLEPFTPTFAAQASGIDADTIRRLAREFAAAAPRCCTLGSRGSAKHYSSSGPAHQSAPESRRIGDPRGVSGARELCAGKSRTRRTPLGIRSVMRPPVVTSSLLRAPKSTPARVDRAAG